jgi:hypothetical protein
MAFIAGNVNKSIWTSSLLKSFEPSAFRAIALFGASTEPTHSGRQDENSSRSLSTSIFVRLFLNGAFEAFLSVSVDWRV